MRRPNIKNSARRLALAVLLVATQPLFAADAVFVFSGQHETEPSNWQQAGNWTLDGGSAGRVPGTGPDDVVSIGAFTVTNCNHTVKALTISGGTLAEGTVTIAQQMQLLGGTLNSCTVNVGEQAVLSTSASAANACNSSVINNHGTFSPLFLQLGALASLPTTVVSNFATGKISLPPAAVVRSGTGAQIFSAGTVEKTAGGGTALFEGVAFRQSGGGSVSCPDGVLSFGSAFQSSPGRFDCDRPISVGAAATVEIDGAQSTLAAGASVSGLGYAVIRHVLVSGPVTVENMSITGSGVLEGPGDVTLTGTLLMNGGGLLGAAQAGPFAKLIIQAGATLQVSAGQGASTIGRSVQNSGTFDGSSEMDLGNQYGESIRPTFNNTATGTVILRNLGGLGARLLVNGGTVQKTGVVDLENGPLLASACANSGLIEVLSGLLKISALSQDAGELRVASGAEARFQGSLSVVSGGSFSGAGTIRTTSSASAVTFGGTLRPGSSDGGLTVVRTENSFVFSSSATVEIEIGGTTPGTGYDRLTLSSTTGNFPLAGTLVIKFVNEFAPTVGQIYSVLSITPDHSGSFAAPGLIGPNGLLIVPFYTSQGLDLAVASDPGTSFAFSGGTSASITHNTAPNFDYSLEYSSDLRVWYGIGNSVAGDGNAHTFTDDFGSAPARFYRVRLNYAPVR